LTSAQILALNETNVQIVPAVAGKYYVFTDLLFPYKFGTTQYQDPNTTTIFVQIGAGAGNPLGAQGSGIAAANLLASGTEDRIASIVGGGTGWGDPSGVSPDEVGNQPITIGTNGNGDVTSGDGTLSVTVCYIAYTF
jgi:hypothetical protein